MKSDFALLFDFETDPLTMDETQLKRLGRLGIAVGIPAVIAGAAMSLGLVLYFQVVSKLIILPGAVGVLMLATGVYRFIIGYVPVVARVRALRMAVMLVILVGLGGGVLGGLLVWSTGD